MKQNRLVIYDVEEKYEDMLSGLADDSFLFSASPLVNHCLGCFCCWVKTPGDCIIRDRCHVIPKSIAKCSELIVLSPVLYGGYSQRIKAVMDRSIGYLLPYFRIIEGEMHHEMRYNNPFKFSVCFYGHCDDDEKNIARRLIRANAINFGAKSSSVSFYKTVDEMMRDLV